MYDIKYLETVTFVMRRRHVESRRVRAIIMVWGRSTKAQHSRITSICAEKWANRWAILNIQMIVIGRNLFRSFSTFFFFFFSDFFSATKQIAFQSVYSNYGDLIAVTYLMCFESCMFCVRVDVKPHVNSHNLGWANHLFEECEWFDEFNGWP